ncbi:MAG: PIG-L family deacetylase [Endomicrobia bacterium]|nr:PIG-L family deacetylase [Endomicrobiia bacterium]MDW8056220.1 PIG-L family deacetylase [Elusimicrobiota bacterium]
MRIKYRNLEKIFVIFKSFLPVKTQLVKTLYSNKILVISPHIDDDIIGAGGSLIRHTSLGKKSSVVYVTIGLEERINEAEAINRIVGYDKQFFLGYKPDHIKKYNYFKEELVKILYNELPDAILIPFLVDNHKDHIIVNKLFLEVVADNKIEVDIFCYEVWTPLFPNFVVDISNVIDIKKRCIEIYKSQLITHNYVNQTLSLNSFRGKVYDVDYAEAFFKTDVSYYLYLWRKIYG